MPCNDTTGPEGAGPRTGRGRGMCGGNGMGKNMEQGGGGMRRGMRQGACHGQNMPGQNMPGMDAAQESGRGQGRGQGRGMCRGKGMRRMNMPACAADDTTEN